MIIADANESPRPGPLVPWWSFSKTVLAAAALVLVDQRRLDLDTPIAGAPYTLRHLLQHTSGLPDYGPLREYHAAVAARETPWSVDTLLERANAATLRFKPGATFAYSNIGYLFVRQMIERASSMDLDAALKALVFHPLGVDDVFIAQSVVDFDRIVWGNDRRYDPGWVYHGCVVGSLSWAAVFLHRLLMGDLLSPSLKAAMLNSLDEPGYGLGVMIDSKKRIVGHTGQGPGSAITVYSFLDLAPPRTLAASVAADRANTADELFGHLQAMAG